jgi:hypothetical protein
MNSKKIVKVLIGENGLPVRIFRHRKEALQFAVEDVADMLHGDAVKSIRWQVWLRCEERCELCGEGITPISGELHEQHPRGKRIDGRLGEYSLQNSIMVCNFCHKNDHPEKRFYSAKVQEF